MSEKHSSPQVNPSHYDFERYMEEERFQSLWYRLKTLSDSQEGPILNVGKGKGLLGTILDSLDHEVDTVDIDPRLDPSVVSDVRDLPFRDNSYSVSSAFQVLEHLPFEAFVPSLNELSRISRDRVIVSVPDSRRYWKVFLKIPLVKNFKRIVSVPRLWEPEHEFDGEHYWSLGRRNYSLSRVQDKIHESELDLHRRFRPYEVPGQHFFVLSV